jgi:hypothetical protein
MMNATPVPCGQLRQTGKHSELTNHAPMAIAPLTRATSGLQAPYASRAHVPCGPHQKQSLLVVLGEKPGAAVTEIAKKLWRRHYF